jgi:hypothetical protein
MVLIASPSSLLGAILDVSCFEYTNSLLSSLSTLLLLSSLYFVFLLLMDTLFTSSTTFPANILPQKILWEGQTPIISSFKNLFVVTPMLCSTFSSSYWSTSSCFFVLFTYVKTGINITFQTLSTSLFERCKLNVFPSSSN